MCAEDVVKLVKHGGLYINSIRVESVEDKLGQKEHLLPGNVTLLQFGNLVTNVYLYVHQESIGIFTLYFVGKKKYRLVEWT